MDAFFSVGDVVFHFLSGKGLKGAKLMRHKDLLKGFRFQFKKRLEIASVVLYQTTGRPENDIPWKQVAFRFIMQKIAQVAVAMSRGLDALHSKILQDDALFPDIGGGLFKRGIFVFKNAHLRKHRHNFWDRPDMIRMLVGEE